MVIQVTTKMMNLILLVLLLDLMLKVVEKLASYGVSGGVQTRVYKSSDDEDLTEEELIQAYRLIYTMWTELTKVCEKTSLQIQQSKIGKNNLQKTIVDLESKLKESQDNVATLNGELESIKRSVKMLNSDSSKLDKILATGRSDKNYFGHGYTVKSIGCKVIFVKESTFDVKNYEDLKASVATPAKTPAVITSNRVGVAIPGTKSTTSPGRKKEKRWIPICHYCNRR